MGKKAQNYRAWRHQNPNGTPEEAWNAAWESHNAIQYSRKIQELEQQIKMLRDGDTCARHCEGTAYRIEARQLKRELDAMKEKVHDLTRTA